MADDGLGGGSGRVGRRAQNERPEYLYRFGLEPESTESLAEQASDAERQGFPHGISVRSRTRRSSTRGARWEVVEPHFAIHKTGRDRYHYTIELPRPVTVDVTDLFNRLFERIGE